MSGPEVGPEAVLAPDLGAQPCDACGGPAYATRYGATAFWRCLDCGHLVLRCECIHRSIAVRAAFAFGDWPPRRVTS